MRPFTSTISLEEARRRLDAAAAPITRTERVPLEHAGGRVAASDVVSTIDAPPFARSAMDGYAVVAADTIGATRDAPVSLTLADRIYTGEMPVVVITPGRCAEIATGSPLPAGADAVVMVEDTRLADGAVGVLAPVAAGQHVARRGADITAGSLVVTAGDHLTPGRVGALAAVGAHDVLVYARPRVAIASTGNEVVEPGEPLPPGRIFDVNRFTLTTIVQTHGGVADPRPPVPDTVDALARALEESAVNADLIVFSGGSSVGERDLIVDAVSGRGEMIFHGIAVKPGKPTAFARVRGVPFFGMPGNPTSCLSNAYVLLIPFLRAVARLPPLRPRTVRVPLGRRIVSQADRHQFYTVRLSGGTALPAFKGSGEITSLSQADGYIEIAADQTVVEEGSEVEVVLF